MLVNRYPLIAREGWLPIGALFLLASGLHIGISVMMAVPFWFGVLLLTILYRDPPRKVPPVPLAVVGPVDGRVIAIEDIDDSLLEREAKRVVLRMGLSAIHSVRNPMEGKIMKQWYGQQVIDPDTYVVLKKTSTKFAQWVQSDEGDDVIVVLKPNKGWPRPRWYPQSGERIGQGQRFGILPFASTVEILLPANSRIDVALGKKVRAGSDTIATLVHQSQKNEFFDNKKLNLN